VAPNLLWMGRVSFALRVLLVVLAVGACSNRHDSDMINVAASLVPEGSQIIDLGDNTGLAILVGDYDASLRIDDGGLGPGLLAAIEEEAAANGWDERYRCEVLAGVRLGYARENFKVDVSVRTNEEPVDASIRIQRIGDGNPWPPDC